MYEKKSTLNKRQINECMNVKYECMKKLIP